MFIIYNGISSESLNADIVVGDNKFSVTPGYRLNTKQNESNDGDINYTTYNSVGRMLANSREISSKILIRRKTKIVDGVAYLDSRDNFMSDISEVVNWLKSDDYKSLVIGEMPDIEWKAIASVNTDKPEFYTDGVIIDVTFKCQPFTTRYVIENVYLGSDISTGSTFTVYGKSAFEIDVNANSNTLVEYKGTAVSNPIIKIGSASNKATATSNSITISIDNNDISVDIGSGKQFYCLIDTKNYIVYINDVISNTKVHIGKTLPYLSGNKENRLRASGFRGKLKLDFKEYYDLSYLGVI